MVEVDFFYPFRTKRGFSRTRVLQGRLKLLVGFLWGAGCVGNSHSDVYLPSEIKFRNNLDRTSVQFTIFFHLVRFYLLNIKILIMKKMAMNLIREKSEFENMYVRELMHI